MINYTASPLDSNKTLLQAFHNIETYLKNNPIYKVYTANIGYTPGTNTYMLSNINVGKNTIAENDVIFFNNAYVGIVSAIGSTEVTVNNVTDIRGPAGATTLAYRHYINLSIRGTYSFVTLYNNSPDPIDSLEKLKQAIVDAGGYIQLNFVKLDIPNSIGIYDRLYLMNERIYIRYQSIALTSTYPAQITQGSGTTTEPYESDSITDIVSTL